MSAQPKANEPSMEEILASIRRIIADDEVKAGEAKPDAPKPDDDISALLAGAAAAQNPPAPPVAAAEDDVLDLASEASLVTELPVAPSAAANDVGDVDFLEPAPIAPVAPLAPELPVQLAPPVQPAAQPALDMAQLLSDQASSSVASAFGQLAHTVLTNNARTLEDLVKDMLKPMLKSWLDDNLPTMVERLVRAEIERVARGGRS